MTTRDEILWRARHGWPPYSVPYDMGTTASPTRHRPDCSGYVSMVLGLPAPGLTTVTLVTSGALVPIPLAEIQPGDVAGRCGPGTDGADGHVVAVEGWLNGDPDDNRWRAWEQCGGCTGPIRSTYDGLPQGWRAYRPTNITGGDDMPLTPTDLAAMREIVRQIVREAVWDILGAHSGVTSDGFVDRTFAQAAPRQYAAWSEANPGKIMAELEKIRTVEVTITASELASALLDEIAARRAG